MKRILLSLFLIGLFATTSLAQISGGFYMIDGYVYFKGQNASGYGLGNITIQCVNSYLGQQLEFTMDFLPNGNSFTIGPSNGWEWQQGEQLFITFANGQSVYWTYQPVPAYDSPYDNYSDDSYSNNLVVREQIRQLESKIRDAERSLRQYEERNRQNPSISNTQLINSQRRLINTYEDRIQQLMRQIR